jgi:hypothetical protein
MLLIKVRRNKAAAIRGNTTGLPRRSNTWRRSTWRVVMPVLQEFGQAAEQREYGRGAPDDHDHPERGFHQLVPFEFHYLFFLEEQVETERKFIFVFSSKENAFPLMPDSDG